MAAKEAAQKPYAQAPFYGNNPFSLQSSSILAHQIPTGL
jgi:hypothetical protein